MYIKYWSANIFSLGCAVGLILFFYWHLSFRKKSLASLNSALFVPLMEKKTLSKKKIKQKLIDSFKPSPNVSATNMRLNILIIFVIIASAFSFNFTSSQYHQNGFFLGINGLIISLLFLLSKRWPIQLKAFIPYFWYLNLIYCLSFLVTTNFVFLHNSLNNWNLIFFLCTFGIFNLLSIFLDRKISMVINCSGFFLSILYCVFAVNHTDPTVLTSLAFRLTLIFLGQGLLSYITIVLFTTLSEKRIAKLNDLVEYNAIAKKEIALLNQDFFELYHRNVQQNVNAETFALETCDAILALSATHINEIKAKLYSLKDYVTDLNKPSICYILKAKFYSDIELINEIKNNLPKSWKFELVFDFNDIKDKKFRLDIGIIKKTLRRFVQDFCKKINDIRPGDIPQILLNFSCVTINYVRESLKNVNGPEETILRNEPALHITLSEYSVMGIKNRVIKPIYKKSLTDIYKGPDDDIELLDIINGIEAHYGLIEIIEDTLIWNCTVPIDVYSVRPVALDLNEPIANFYNSPQAENLERKFLEDLQNFSLKCSFYKVHRAIDVIKRYHSHQIRKSGEPYYMHPLAVGDFLLKLIKTENSEIIEILEKNVETLILGALLHDILEDTIYTSKAILLNFGNTISDVVLEVSKIDVNARKILLTNEEAFNTLITKGPIPLSIKLIDRYHNLSTIAGHSNVAKRYAIAQETLNFFIEPAERYGFNILAKLLERMCDTILKTGSLKSDEFIY